MTERIPLLKNHGDVFDDSKWIPDSNHGES